GDWSAGAASTVSEIFPLRCCRNPMKGPTVPFYIRQALISDRRLTPRTRPASAVPAAPPSLRLLPEPLPPYPDQTMWPSLFSAVFVGGLSCGLDTAFKTQSVLPECPLTPLSPPLQLQNASLQGGGDQGGR